MKRIIICYVCKEASRHTESYPVSVENYAEGNDLEARICRKCARDLGYKVRK